MDSTLDTGTSDSGQDDLPVVASTLEIDGTRPAMGDKVELKVQGTVSKIVNETVFVTPETVNGQPIPQEAEQSTSDEDLMAAAQSHDMAMGNQGY